MKKKVIVTAIMLCSLLAGCGNSLYEKEKEGYTQVTSINGVTFDMPSNMLSQATAISMISNEQYYDGTYVYKNGKDKYLLFNMDSIIVACEAGTSFGLKESDTEAETITSSDVEGVWLSPVGNKLDYVEKESDGVYKFIAAVSAEASVTQTQYGSFIGKVAVVDDGNTEWALFVGAKGNTLTSTQEATIEHIVKSLKTTGIGYSAAGESVASSEEHSASTEETELEIETENISDVVIEATEATETPETTTEEYQEVVSTESTDYNKEETETEEVTEQETETESESTKNQEIKEDNTVTEEDAFVPDGPDVQDVPVVLDDELIALKENAVTSRIYEWAEIGTACRADLLGKDATYTVHTVVRLDKVYTGSEAEELLLAYGIKDTPKEGTSFHVASYTIATDPEEEYCNVKIEGVDGERLKYRGISYTTRTYDCFTASYYSDGVYKDVLCYYEVPNGCKEYMLEFGQRGDLNVTGCYIVSN